MMISYDDIKSGRAAVPAEKAPEVRDYDLDLSEIKLDQSAQPREALNNDRIAEYADAMKAGDQFPPLAVFHDGSTYWLADGFHRHYAAQHAGRKHIRCHVRRGGLRDAILWSVGANAKHGLARSQADKERAVLRLLNDDEWGQWSDRKIAGLCHVDHKTVARIRKDVSGEFPQIERKVQRGGTVYTQKVAKARATAAPAPAKAAPAPHEERVTAAPEPHQSVEPVAQTERESEAADAHTDAERDAYVIQWEYDRASDEGRALFLARNNLQFQAKASEDNGATGEATMRPADSMAGEASRFDAGRTASATSERMDATAGETALNSNPQEPTSSPVTADKAGEMAPPPAVSPAAPFSALSKADQIRLLRPFCQHADDLEKCGGSGRNHCTACRKIAAEASGEAA